MKKFVIALFLFFIIVSFTAASTQILTKAQITEEEVIKLYEYIPYPDVYNIHGIFTHDDNTSYPDVQKVIGDIKYDRKYGMNAINRIIIKRAMEYFKIIEPENFTECRLEYLDDFPHIPAVDFIKLYKSMYGEKSYPPSFVHQRGNWNQFIYDEKTDCYVYNKWDGDGVDGYDNRDYRNFKSFEENGDELYIYDKFGLYINDFGSQYTVIDGQIVMTAYYDYEYKIYGSCNYWGEIVLILAEGQEESRERFIEDKNSVYNQFLDGKLDDMLLTYKHTFRKNSDGSYYWYSTEIDNYENLKQNYTIQNPDTADNNMFIYILTVISTLGFMITILIKKQY